MGRSLRLDVAHFWIHVAPDTALALGQQYSA
jgi:hypothetical protein